MTQAEIEQEISTLEQQIEDNKVTIAEIVGVPVEELDLANLPTEGLDEEQAAEVQKLVQEINSLSMRIEALNEMLGNASAAASNSFNGEV